MLHNLGGTLDPENDTAMLRTLLQVVQKTLDDFKKIDDVHESSLHVLENSAEIIKTNLADTDEIRQINLDFERRKGSTDQTNWQTIGFWLEANQHDKDCGR